MKIVEVDGSPRERGRVIGESLRADIQVVLQNHRQAIVAKGYSVDTYFAEFDAYGNYASAAEKWAPGLLEEVCGLAEGADIEPAAALRLQLLDEDWFFDAYHFAPKARIRNKCTAFGIVGDKGSATFAGQNMDIMNYVDGHQVLLRIRHPDSDLESLVFTYAGLIGLVGMNNSPLGVNCNTLMQLGCRPDGLPVAFITRSILAMSSFDDAVSFLSSIKHAAGQNYTLSTRGQVGSFECSPHSVVEYRPRSDGRRVCHTNHPIANDDVDSFSELIKRDPDNRWARSANSHSRLASIAARTLHSEQPFDVDSLKSALLAKDDPDNPVCRDGSTDTASSVIAFTAGSMIYEYGEQPRLHLAAGPPSQSDYVAFGFSH